MLLKPKCLCFAYSRLTILNPASNTKTGHYCALDSAHFPCTMSSPRHLCQSTCVLHGCVRMAQLEQTKNKILCNTSQEVKDLIRKSKIETKVHQYGNLQIDLLQNLSSFLVQAYAAVVTSAYTLLQNGVITMQNCYAIFLDLMINVCFQYDILLLF